MKPTTANRKSKDILRALMDPSQPDTVPWSSSELRAILEHQLTTPLVMEVNSLALCGGCDPGTVMQLIDESKCRTFGEFLSSANPSREMLGLVKDFAKSAMSEADVLPRDVARIIYVSAILRGQQTKGSALTSLDEGSIEREARRCLSFGWLTETVRAIIRKGLKTQ